MCWLNHICLIDAPCTPHKKSQHIFQTEANRAHTHTYILLLYDLLCTRISRVCDSVASYNLSNIHWCTVARCKLTSKDFHCMRASKRYNFMKHLRRFPKINLSIILKLSLDYRPKRSDPSNTSYVRIILECYGIMCASLCICACMCEIECVHLYLYVSYESGT